MNLRSLISPGLAAVRHSWKPFLLLQFVAFLLVVGYYNVPAIRSACETLSDIRQRGGVPLAMFMAAVAGAILPELAKALVLRQWFFPQHRRRDIVFNFFTFAGSGLIVHYQYAGLALLLGEGTDMRTIVLKMLIDQFICTPIYGVPYWIIATDLRANHYHPLRTLKQITPAWYVTRALPLLVTAWAFWIPMVMLVYSLPSPLQFLLFAFALAAWSLLMVFITKKTSGKS